MKETPFKHTFIMKKKAEIQNRHKKYKYNKTQTIFLHIRILSKDLEPPVFINKDFRE